MKKLGRLTVLMFALFFLYGCELALVGLGAGAGILSYKYVDGLLMKEYPLEYAKAWDEANAVLGSLQISITDSFNEGKKGRIIGVRKDGAKVAVSLKDMGQKVTSIGVRVGALGDRIEAEKIHTAIASAAGI